MDELIENLLTMIEDNSTHIFGIYGILQIISEKLEALIPTNKPNEEDIN